MHWEENRNFSGVTSFNLDEYVGLSPDHPQSYHYYMRENFFRHVNINPKAVHIPDGTAKDIRSHCEAYERAIHQSGGINLQLWGLVQMVILDSMSPLAR
jgi:glucosamine-6-phosphate deaminase